MTLEELFHKYLTEDITAAELRHLREMAALEENREELDRLLTRWIQSDLHVQHPEALDTEAVWSELTEKWDIPTVPAGGRGKNGLIRIFLLSAAAACVLVVARVFLVHHPAPGIPVVKAKTIPIIPAGTKATLTLANGKRITLDSAANGDLAQQGSTRVVKLDDGQLAYQAGGKGVNGGASNGGGDVSDAMYNEISTPRGGFYQLALPDGSRVWLDVASKLRFPTVFSGKERSVELTGEAYFEIAPHAGQPFFVTSNGVKVAVLGTAFNLMAYQDEDAVRVTLVNGAIKVAMGSQNRLAKPGQQVSWTHGSDKLELSEPDLRQVMAWKQGEFRFDGLPISSIMRQIARWYDVDVECKGAQPSNQFSGVIPRKKDVKELLTVLEQTDEVHFTIEGRKIILEAVKLH